MPPLREAQFQQQVLQLARLNGWWCYHTYDSRRSQPGLPDLILIRERVVWAELKVRPNRLRPNQKDCLNRLQNAQQETYVWYPEDWDAIVQILQKPPGTCAFPCVSKPDTSPG